MNLLNKKMRLLCLMALLMAFSFQVSAQILDPVKWSYGAKRTGKDEVVVEDGGPVKTLMAALTYNNDVYYEKDKNRIIDHYAHSTPRKKQST